MTNTLLQLSLGALMLLSGATRAFGAALPRGAMTARSDLERTWESIVLPANFVLDLQSGVVANRPEGDRPTLTYSRGRLMSASPLRLLPPNLSRGRTVIDRDGGEAVPGTTPVVGQELIFDCFDEAWGYLRVLEVSLDSITLEYLLEPDLRRRELLREPARLRAKSGPSGVLLSWPSEGSSLYRIERRRVARGPTDRPSDWFEVARVGGTEWLDDETALGYLTEYRVSRDGPNGGFGCAALGVAGIEPPEVRCEVGPGTEVNLLSAVDDDLRVDITVEYVRSNGVQIFPGEGVEARMLTPEEEQDWSLQEVLSEGYRKQRFFVPPGRVLALRLPEGIHCLMRIESVREKEQLVTIGRQVDLDGERIFPPIPDVPMARWDAERGVVFEFPEPRKSPPSGEPILFVEREGTLDAGNWTPCVRGEPGQRTLVDSGVGEQLLVRYRFRQGLEGGQSSLSSGPLTVLVGGDSESSRAKMLERAMLDLGSKDYDRRGRARAMILALDEDARPALRDALRSDNAELASAARELLLSDLKENHGRDEAMAGGLAWLFISIRAEDLGADLPPHPDWMSGDPGARASAVLCGLGWRETTAGKIALWRQILAEVDPEEAVRQCAGLASLLDAQGLGPDLGPRVPTVIRSDRGGDEWLFDPIRPEDREPRSRDPWTELVQLQARHELEGSVELPSEEYGIAQERRALARYLTAHFDRTGDELFLDCALKLIEDPTARLRGALDLALERRQAVRAQSEDAESVQVVRLEAANTDLLVEELEMLRAGPNRRVQFILPAGIYESLPDGRRIELEGASFHLKGEGGTELQVGFNFMKDCDVVLENLSIVPEADTAVRVDQSRVVLRDCLLSSGHLGLLGTDAVVELQRTAIVSPRNAGPNTAGVRFSGRSMLLASESRIESAGVALYGARAALLDRCVVISTHRNAIEGGGSSDLWLVNSLVQADKAPFSRITQGVLEGAILFGELEAGLSTANGLRVCAEHLRCSAELSEFDRALWLESCTLGR